MKMKLKKLFTPILSALAFLCLLVGALSFAPKTATPASAETTSNTLKPMLQASFTVVDGKQGQDGESYDKLFDDDTTTKYCLLIENNPYVVLRANNADTIVTGYKFCTARDTNNYSDRNPRDWTLYGSNDYSESAKSGSWTEVHKVTGDTTMGAYSCKFYEFFCSASSSYKYYKFEFTARRGEANEGGDMALFQLSELEMMATIDESRLQASTDYFSVDASKTTFCVNNNAVNNVVDGNATTGAEQNSTSEATFDLVLKAASPFTRVTGYRIYFDDGAGYGNPTQWTLSMGSSSDSMTLYHTNVMSIYESGALAAFSNNANNYKFYKFTFTIPANTTVRICEIVFRFEVKCEHTWSTSFTERLEAGCETDGNRKYQVCANDGCGAYQYYDDGALRFAYSDEYDSLIKLPKAHTYGTWTEQKAANCTETGWLKYRQCTICSVYEYIDGENSLTCASTEYDAKIKLAALGHNCGVWTAEVPATCSTTGTKGHKTCSRCEKNFDFNDNEIADLTIEKDLTVHDFGTWKTEESATCSATGTKGHKTCAWCKKNFDDSGNEIADLTIEKDLTAHRFPANSWIDKVPATCTETGVKGHRTCLLCNKNYDTNYNEIESLTIAVDPTNHAYGDETAAVTPTCEGVGNYAYKQCSRCGGYTYAKDCEWKTCASSEYAEKVQRAANGHRFTTEMNSGEPATCENDGYRPYRQCTVCGKYEYKDGNGTAQTCDSSDYDTLIKLAANGHNFPADGVYNGWDEEEHWQACRNENCSERNITRSHSYTSACDKTCNDCGYTRPDSELVHNYTENYATRRGGSTGQQHFKWCENAKDGGGTCSLEQAGDCVWAEDEWHLFLNYNVYYHTNVCTICEKPNANWSEKCEFVTHDNGDGTHCEWCSVGRHKKLDDSDVSHQFRSKATYLTGREGNYHDRRCFDCNAWEGDPQECELSGWKTDDDKHWKECTDCGQKFETAEHNFVMAYGYDYHWYECSVCGKMKKNSSESHEFETESSTTCLKEGCEFKRFFDVKILLDGYKVNERIGDATISATTKAENVTFTVEWLSFFNEDWDRILFAEGKEDEFATFQPNTWYCGKVYFDLGTAYPAEALKAEDFDLPDGVVISEFDWNKMTRRDGTWYISLEVDFTLLPQGGVSTEKKVPALKVTIGGFALNAKVGDVTVTVDSENVTVADVTLYRYDYGEMGLNDVITDEKLIMVDFELRAKEGYNFFGFTKGDVTIVDELGVVYYADPSEGGCALYVSVDMLSFVKEHECVYGYFQDPDDMEESVDPEHKHLGYCDICAAEKYFDHEYDDDLDAYCNDCGYERDILVEELFISLSGYAIDQRVVEASVSMFANDYDLTVSPGFSSFDPFLVLDENGMEIRSETARFLPDVQYSLALCVRADFVDLMLPNMYFGKIYVNGVETEIAFSSLMRGSGTTGIYFLKLSPLKGKSAQKKVTKVELSATGIALGNKLEDVDMADIKHPAIDQSKSEYFFDCDESSMNNTDVFTAGKTYCVWFYLALGDMYYATDIKTGDITFGDYKNVSAIYVFEERDYDSGKYYTYVMCCFLLHFDTDETHTHAYTKTDEDGKAIYVPTVDGHAPLCECGALGEMVEHTYVKNPITCDDCGFTRTVTVDEFTMTFGNYRVGTSLYGIDVDYDKDMFDIEIGEIVEGFDYENVSTAKEVNEIRAGKKYTFIMMVALENANFASGYRWGDLALENYVLKIGEASVTATLVTEMAMMGTKIKTLYFDLPVLDDVHLHGGEWVDEIPATCVATGVKGHYVCTICGEKFDANDKKIDDLTIAIDLTKHVFGEWTAEIPATCSATGTKGHKDCSVCGKHFDTDGNELDNLTIAIDPAAHDFGEWIVEVDPTKKEEGVKAHKDCSICGRHFDVDSNEIDDLTIEKLKEKGCKSSLETSSIVVMTAVFAAVMVAFNRKRASKKDEE